MRIVLDGRKVERSCLGFYLKNTAFFTKKGLRKRIVLHELYHHLIEKKGLDIRLRTEENEANRYSKEIFRKGD